MANNRLTVWLGVNNDPLMRGFAGAGRAAQSFASQTRAMAGSSKSGTFALLELSRAAEDASVGFGTNGLKGAIMGAGNNITAFLALINPMAAVIGGVALALTSLLVGALQRTKKETDDARKSLEDYQRALDGVVEARKAQREFGRDIGRADTAEESRKLLGTLGSKRVGVDDEINALREELRVQTAGARAFMGNFGIDPATGKPQAASAADVKELSTRGDGAQEKAAKLLELQERLNGKLKERETLQNRLLATHRQMTQQQQAEADQAQKRRQWDSERIDLEEEIRAGMGRGAAGRKADDEARAAALEESHKLAVELEKKLNPKAAARREVEQRYLQQLQDINRFQALGAISPQQATLLQNVALRSGARDLKEIDKPDAPDRRLPETLRKGSAEAFRIINQSRSQRNPNARLETIGQQQLSAQQELNRNFDRFRTQWYQPENEEVVAR